MQFGAQRLAKMNNVSLVPGWWWECPSCTHKNIVSIDYDVYVDGELDTPYVGGKLPESVECAQCHTQFKSAVGSFLGMAL